MISRGGKFSGAYSICWDERAPLAEELMSSIEIEDEEDDSNVVSFASLREDSEPPRAADEEAPVSEPTFNQWQEQASHYQQSPPGWPRFVAQD